MEYALGFRNAKITPKVREQVIVRIGAVADCEYQLVQHKSEALRTGTSQELLADLINPPQQEFDDAALTALVTYVDSLVTNVGADQEALDALRKHFPDNEVAEITLLAGTYMLCAAFLKSLRVPLDDGPVDWAAASCRRQQGRRDPRVHVPSITPTPDRCIRQSGFRGCNQVTGKQLDRAARPRR